MSAQSRKRSTLFSWNSIPNQSTSGPWMIWLALPLIILTPGSRAYAGCGGSSGCSSGSCSSGAGPQANANPMMNQVSSSRRGDSMQNQYGSSDSPPLPPSMGPHGGILSTLQNHQAEVVFTPQETRVYLYTATGEPLAVRGVQGEVSMKIRGIPKIYRYALRETSDARDRSFLALRVNASQLRDGDMEATFELSGLPSRNEPRARFVQTFALTQPAAIAPPETAERKSLEVRRVAVTPADRPLIARQKICPITQEPLDSMGGVIKLMVGNQPLFVCCEGCVDQVKNNPTMLLAKLNR